jgi:hypothetical protein
MDSLIHLTSDELAMLHRGEPLRARANESEEVVIVMADQYERLKQFAEFADTDPKALYTLLANVSPDDWDDLTAYPAAEKL